jgi:hypothetical protein
MSSQKKQTLVSAKEKVWAVKCYNELQFNNYYNLLTMFFSGTVTKYVFKNFDTDDSHL